MPDYRRDEVLGRLRTELDSGKHLLAVGAGTGITAKFAEQRWCRPHRNLQLRSLPNVRIRLLRRTLGLR